MACYKSQSKGGEKETAIPDCQVVNSSWVVGRNSEIVYDQPTLGLMKYIHQCQKLSDPGDKTRSALKLNNVTR